jgi:hypothetical protein
MGFLIPGSLVRVQPGVLEGAGKPVPFSFQARVSFVDAASILTTPQICTVRSSLREGVGPAFGPRHQPRAHAPSGVMAAGRTRASGDRGLEIPHADESSDWPTIRNFSLGLSSLAMKAAAPAGGLSVR